MHGASEWWVTPRANCFSVTNPETPGLSEGANPIVTGIINNAGIGAYGDLGHYIVVNETDSGDMITLLYYMANGGIDDLGDAICTASGIDTDAYVNSLTLPFSTTMIPGTAGTFFVAILWTAGIEVIWYSPSHPSADSGTLGSPEGVYAIPMNGRIWGIGSASATNNIENLYVSGIYYTGAISYVATNTYSWTATSSGASGEANPAIVDFDDPNTFTAWGTMTNGEVLMIKNGEGAVLIIGDIYSPTIEKLPAVRGTNNLFGQAQMTPLGLVYRSHGNGVWAWNGGSTSQKISAQLSDSVWYDSNPDGYVYGSATALQGAGMNVGLDGPNNMPAFTVTYAQNMIFFDSGFFYNLDTNSWWRLPIYADDVNAWAQDSVFCPFMYAVNHDLTDGTNPFPCPISAVYFDVAGGDQTAMYHTNYAFDLGGGSYEFTPPSGCYGSYWESNPIQLATEGFVEIQEISVVIQGNGTLSVQISGDPGTIALAEDETIGSVSRISARPLYHTIRDRCNQDKIRWTNASGDTVTPIIESLQIDYVERFPVAGST